MPRSRPGATDRPRNVRYIDTHTVLPPVLAWRRCLKPRRVRATRARTAIRPAVRGPLILPGARRRLRHPARPTRPIRSVGRRCPPTVRRRALRPGRPGRALRPGRPGRALRPYPPDPPDPPDPPPRNRPRARAGCHRSGRHAGTRRCSRGRRPRCASRRRRRSPPGTC